MQAFNTCLSFSFSSPPFFLFVSPLELLTFVTRIACFRAHGFFSRQTDLYGGINDQMPKRFVLFLCLCWDRVFLFSSVWPGPCLPASDSWVLGITDVPQCQLCVGYKLCQQLCYTFLAGIFEHAFMLTCSHTHPHTQKAFPYPQIVVTLQSESASIHAYLNTANSPKTGCQNDLHSFGAVNPV